MGIIYFVEEIISREIELILITFSFFFFFLYILLYDIVIMLRYSSGRYI